MYGKTRSYVVERESNIVRVEFGHEPDLTGHGATRTLHERAEVWCAFQGSRPCVGEMDLWITSSLDRDVLAGGRWPRRRRTFAKGLRLRPGRAHDQKRTRWRCVCRL